MKTTNKHFKPQTLSMQEMRVVEGGISWLALGIGLASTVVTVVLIKDYYDAKRETVTGEYDCGCNN